MAGWMKRHEDRALRLPETGAAGGSPPVPQSDEADDLYSLTPELERDVIAAVYEGREEDVRVLVEPLHYAEVADLIEHMPADIRLAMIAAIRPGFHPEILPELDDAVRREVVEQIGIAGLARAIARLESDDALELIDSLDEVEQRKVMLAIPAALRALLEEGLSYPEDSAGRLMQRDLIAVPTFWTVGEVIDFMRETDDLPEDIYDLFVVDPKHRPIGKLSLSRLLRTQRPVFVGDVMSADLTVVPVATDQEDVAILFRNHDLVSAPVVDGSGRLIGVITIDDVVDVIDEEAEEDLMRLAGVRETDLYHAALDTTKSRFSWLLINLFTAVMASSVIALFEATIEQIVALAVLMPIVASMGGNAGTQTLTVAVRALAMKDLTAANSLRVMGKELLVGAMNGVLFAVLTGAVTWLWFGSIEIAMVISIAMVVNLVVAGLAGTAIPIGLARRGIDPAVASAVFLTTVTDVVGFFAFLGLAAWVLM